MMMTSIKDFLKVFLFTDSIVIMICFFIENNNWLINTQVAFLSSLIISLGTFLSYSKNVNTNVNELSINDTDTIDKMDDPYDLYSEDIIENKEKDDFSKDDIQEAMKPIKNNYIANLKASLLTYASFYRIFGYIILVSGFFYLLNNNYLNVYSYFLGFLIVPISMFIILFIKKNDN